MEPKITRIAEDKEKLNFTLSGVKTCIANAIRRTILSDININICYTEKHNENQCEIETNTTRFHNEIIKQRLSSIPIHMKELSVLPGNYELIIDVSNDSDDISYITTENFRIKSIATGSEIKEEELRKIYPPSKLTGQYIDFVRLRPKMSDTIKGEKIKLKCGYSIGNAKMNSMFNVASVCSYGNTIDIEKAQEEWSKQESLLKNGGTLSETEIEFEKKNFYALDAQRCFVENSFDFVIETIGIYENKELVLHGCVALIERLNKVIEKLDNDEILITNAELATANAYNISFEDEDYTLGKLIEDRIHDKHFIQDKSVTFCAFKKIHPHDMSSILKLAFVMDVDNNYVRQIIRTAIVECVEVIDKIHNLFK